MARQLSIEPDPAQPETRHIVKDTDGTFIGAIHKTGPDEWQNLHVAQGKPSSPVPRGPYQTVEAAFDAFIHALAPHLADK
jgi:hypothetical protein